MTPAEAIEAAELAGAEIRYRHQVAREMAGAGYERGHAAGYLRAIADVKATQHGLVLDAELRPGAGDLAAVPTSPEHGGQACALALRQAPAGG